MADLRSLLSPTTAETALDTAITLLASAKWPTTAWSVGSTPRTLLSICIRAVADLSSRIVDIAKGGYLQLASGEWLDILAESAFQVTRQGAQTTTCSASFSDNSGIGPVTVPAGSMTIGDGTSRFVNTDAFTISLNAGNGTVPVAVGTFAATVSGSAPNASVSTGGLTILAGAVSGYQIGVVSMVSPGVDTEQDEDLRNRCVAKWSSLGCSMNQQAIQYIATTVGPTIAKVRVTSDGAGSIFVRCAGPANATAPSAADLAAAQAALDIKRSYGTTIYVQAASSPALDLVVDCYVRPSFLTAVQADATAALLQYLGSVPIGGKVQINRVIACFAGRTGVLRVYIKNSAGVVQSQTSDITLAVDQSASVPLSNIRFWPTTS